MKALSAIHINGAIHRDVKADNVLVTGIDEELKGPRIKLADFGFATPVDPGIGMRVSLGTRMYMSPEVLRKDSSHTSALDIWAVGVLAYYLVSQGNYPFPGINKEAVDNKILTLEPDLEALNFDKNNQFAMDAKNFMQKCLNKTPEERPSAKDLLDDDDFIKRVNMRNDERISEDLMKNVAFNVKSRTQFV